MTAEQNRDRDGNPEDFKGEPIPGGPTDPDAPRLAGEDEKG